MAHIISHRVASFLEHNGLPVSDAENSYLSLDGLEDNPMLQIHGHSITYRIAVGSQQGRKVFTLQTIPAKIEHFVDSERVAKVAGFSLPLQKRSNEISWKSYAVISPAQRHWCPNPESI